MYVFVDESGTFTTPESAAEDSWCVVVAYAVPEADQTRLDRLVETLRSDLGGGTEVKLRNVPEARYIRFLRDLSRLHGLAFAVAVDVSLHGEAVIRTHRDAQAMSVIEHRDRLVHESARAGLTKQSDAIRSLPLQLYVQLQCQIELFHKVLSRAPVYYSQHAPDALAAFRWRLDRKNAAPTAYEQAFRTILPAALQSKSLREPIITLTDADNSFLERFEFPPGEFPTYLSEEYGIITGGEGLDVGRMIGEDFQLVDSAQVAGVQAADLLASGLRRLFRGSFHRSHEVALALGANMVSELRGSPLVRLITLGVDGVVSTRSAQLLKTMASAAKPLLA